MRSLLTVVALLVAEVCGAIAAFGLPGAPDSLRTIAASCGVALAALALAAVLVRFVDRQPIRSLGLGLSSAAFRGTVAGLTIVMASIGVATVVAVAAGLTEPSRAGWSWSLAASAPVVLVQAFVLQGIPEEILFRGYLVHTALGRLPGWGVIALSTLLFGSIHIVSQSDATTLAQRLLFLLIPTGFGALATVMRMVTNSVWPAVAVHGGLHLSVFIVGGWVTPSPSTYGTYLVVVGGTLLVASAALTLWAVRTGRIAWRKAPPVVAGATRE